MRSTSGYGNEKIEAAGKNRSRNPAFNEPGCSGRGKGRSGSAECRPAQTQLKKARKKFKTAKKFAKEARKKARVVLKISRKQVRNVLREQKGSARARNKPGKRSR
jgi:hypothetical protein